MSDQEGERIAVLETQFDEMDRRLGVVESMSDDVHEIKNVISRYKGFWGGIVFAASMLSGIIGALIAIVWHKVSN